MIFRLTPPGTYTELYALNGTTDSSLPLGVIQASDGNLYGAAGSFRPGTVFKFQLSNLEFTTLYNFPSGIFPLNRVTEASNGLLYGSTRPTNATNGSFVVTIFSSDLTGNVQDLQQLTLPAKKTIRSGAVSASDGWKSMEHVVCGRKFRFGYRVLGDTLWRDGRHAVVQSRRGRVPDWRRDSGKGWDAVWNSVGRWDGQGASVGERNGVFDQGSAAQAVSERQSQAPTGCWDQPRIATSVRPSNGLDNVPPVTGHINQLSSLRRLIVGENNN